MDGYYENRPGALQYIVRWEGRKEGRKELEEKKWMAAHSSRTLSKSLL